MTSSGNEPTPVLDGGSLVDKVAWVTGASRSLGRAVALGLAQQGARAALAARDNERLWAVTEEIAEAGGDALVAPGSVTNPGLIESIGDVIVEAWGRIDMLANNAGISPALTRSQEVITEEWQRVVDVNLTGVFFCAQASARRMSEGGAS